MTDSYSSEKPAFDPSKPFEATASGKPAFDPSRPFESVGQTEAFTRALHQGVTANFGDELTGLRAAGGAGGNVNILGIPVGQIVGAGRLGYEALTGRGEATKAYESARDIERKKNKDAETQFPKTTLTGNLIGGIATPIGTVGRAATLGGRVLRSAGVGAGFGALSGAGEGEGLGDTITKAATSAIIGAPIGALAPPLVEGAIQGGHALARPITAAFRGAIDPESEAARRVVSAIGRDVQVDPGAETRLTPAEFGASRQSGGPAALIDLGGGLTRRLADTSAIASPEGSAALNRTINNRYETQADRFTDWLNSNFHYPNAHAQQQAIDQVERQVNGPAYQRAFAAHDGPMWDQSLGELAQDPVVQSAIRRAQVATQSSRTRDGFRPMNTPFEFEASSGRLTQRRDPNGNPMYPDLRFWNEVKKQLDKTGSPESRSFARVLRDHLDELTTDASGNSLYQSARQGAAHFFGAENALEAGQNFVTSKLGNREARQGLADMSENERQLFRDGFVSRFVESVNEIGDRRNVLNSISGSNAARERLNMVLGHQRANELEAMLRVEGIMDLARGAVQGNSWTARRLYDLGLAGGTGLGTVGTYNLDPTEMTVGAVTAAIASGGKRIDSRVARHVAEMLASSDPAVLARGLNLVVRNHRFMDALRTTDQRIARAGIQQTPVPALQSGGIGRADQNEPNVPRPPSQ